MAGKQPKRKDRPGVDRYSRTELHNAIIDGDVSKAQALIATGARVDLPDDNGWTPLHYAAQTHSAVLAELLLAAGAPVDAQDSNGNTPLSTAVFESRGQGNLITPQRPRRRSVAKEFPRSFGGVSRPQHRQL